MMWDVNFIDIYDFETFFWHILINKMVIYKGVSGDARHFEINRVNRE